MIRTRVYRNGTVVAENFDPARVSDYLESPDCVVWMDVCAPEGGDIATVAEEVGINPLAVEDAIHGRQRPKLDRYGHTSFLVVYDVALDVDSGVLDTEEVSLFLGERYLITARRRAGFDVDALLDRWDAAPQLAASGAGFLLHGVLDLIADHHLDVVSTLDLEIDRLEDVTFAETPATREVQLRSYRLRKSLVQLRRVLLPMREVMGALLRAESPLAGDTALRPYLLDVYDHVARAEEETNMLQDLVTTIFETHLTLQGNRSNDVMKKLTSYGALFAVATAVTGYYGMNVRTWPHQGTTIGGVFALALMVVLLAALWLAFRRRDWL